MNYIKTSAIFLAGIGVGVLGAKKFFECKYEKLFQEELESVKNSRIYMGHIPEDNSVSDVDFAKKVEKEVSKENSDKTTLTSIYEEETKDIVDYSSAYDRDSVANNQKPLEVGYPYLVDYDDYIETEYMFDKNILHYYSDDGVLVYHDTGVPIERDFGEEAYRILDTSDESSLYFRDYTYGFDYEIVIIKGGYYIDKS